MNKTIRVAALGGALALALAACGSAPEDEAGASAGASSPAASEGAVDTDFKACLVSDSGGFDDRSFNQSAAEGLTRAGDELGVQTNQVQSTTTDDFTPNIQAMVADDCNLIIGVGFLLEDAIQTAAESNPDIEFALVDSAFSDADYNPVTIENAKPLLFNTQEAAFLAGYVAAGTSATGTVATFGGIQLPSVSIFMDGFADGVDRYNEDSGSSVGLLGWDKTAQTGSFTGDFETVANGQNTGQGFIDQGADVIMPVAGPVGQGAAAAAEAAGDTWIIGVDSDWYESSPEYSSLILTSVIKQIGNSVYDTIAQAAEGEFSAEPYIGTLANGGVDLAPFHDADALVTDEVKTAVEDYKQQIIDGDLTIESDSAN